MATRKYGLKSMLISDIDPADGSAVVAGQVEVLSEIYRDTFNIAETDGTTTEHFAEMATTADLSIKEVGSRSITFQCLNTSPARLALFLGGEVVSANSKDTWSAPETSVINEKHVKITMLDDTEIIMPRASVTGKTDFQIRRNAPILIGVTIAPLTPSFAGLKAFSVSEPTA